MRITTICAVIALTVTSTALAQTTMNRRQQEEATAVIIEVGGTCERIVRSQAIGELEDRTTLMAIACSGGEHEQYVLQLDRRGNMMFYATCENLAIGTNNQIRCFAQGETRLVNLTIS